MKRRLLPYGEGEHPSRGERKCPTQRQHNIRVYSSIQMSAAGAKKKETADGSSTRTRPGPSLTVLSGVPADVLQDSKQAFQAALLCQNSDRVHRSE